MNLAEYAEATGIRPYEFQKLLRDEHGLELRHETVRRWFNGTLMPGPKKMPVIEAATRGKVTRYDQRPDIFGSSPKRKRAA